MDEEIMENLKELADHIQGVGRMIGSTKITIEKLVVMKECLEMGAGTLENYIEILKGRYAEL